MTGTQKKTGTMGDERDDGKDGVFQNILEKLRELTAAKQMTAQNSLPRLSQNSDIGCYSCQETGHVSRECPNGRGSDRRMSRSGEHIGYSENTIRGIRGNNLNYQGPDLSVEERSNQQ